MGATGLFSGCLVAVQWEHMPVGAEGRADGRVSGEKVRTHNVTRAEKKLQKNFLPWLMSVLPEVMAAPLWFPCGLPRPLLQFFPVTTAPLAGVTPLSDLKLPTNYPE